MHSIYHAPSAELFVADGRRFTMYAVVSLSGGVLDYYALEGRRTRLTGGRFRLDLDEPVTYSSIDLLATSLGQRTLVAGDRCLPLFPPTGAASVRLELDWTQSGTSGPCPAYSQSLFLKAQ
ncbi:hypothetical protein [Nonomuraea soli]|uniref:Uncharacterized protein n=1 Tax=Nonomuraea soli TaxID=1032476 RepID=A0A7W0HPB3_9ACTN|nr:hypothetical protein [Nonomuraea soli]MBA2890396.1 hypothetical protein [Nonomuraea soli]